MANQKISQLTEQTDLSLIDGLAGYEGTSNVRISGPNIISAIPTLYSGNGTIGTSRVATITDFPKFSGDQGNPIGLEIENTRSSNSAHSTQGAQLKLTARAGASSTISFYNGLGGGSTRPAMVIDSPAGIQYTAGSTYLGYHHRFRGSTWTVGMTNSPLNVASPRLEMLLGGGGSNGSFYTTKINGSNDFLYMWMSPGTAARHIALGEYTSSGAVYKDFLRINSTGDIGINQDTPTAKLHVTGSGSTNATTSLLVENSLGDEIIKVLDDQTVRLGFNGNQITTSTASSGTVNLNNNSGSTIFRASVVSGSTGKINVLQGGWRSFEYAANKGLALSNQAGFHITQDDSSMLTCVSSTKGMLPPRMTTTQRDAINSGTFTTGLTLYNTTDNKLQYYDGTDWQSPSSEPYLDVFDTSPASPDPLSIYNDGTIQIWLDESASDDIEVQVLTDPAESADVNFTWWSPTAGTDGSININAADGRTQLNAGFNNNDVHQMNVFAPTDTSFPYYEVRITKTDTGFTGVPAIIRVSKYTI